MLLGFRNRFAAMVEDGSKTHTIRAPRGRMPSIGEMCHCYVNPRQKTMRLLGRWPLVKVEEIAIIRAEAGEVLANVEDMIVIDGVRLSFDEANALAWRDGFRSRGREWAFDEMLEFWRGRLPFYGHIFHWKREEAR